MPEQALVDERLQRVEVCVHDLLGGLERAAAAEDGQPGEEPLLVCREQVVRPGDRRPQRLLARVGVAAGPEQVQSLRDPLDDLCGCEHPDPGGGELERQRQVVQPAAQLGNRLVRLDARPRAEQLDRLRLRERRHRVDDLAVDPQQLPAGDEQAQVRTGPQQRRQLDRRLDHLLQVVEHEQELLVADVPRELLLRPQRLRHRVHDQRRIADRRQPDPEDPGSELAHQLPGRLERQPRLPRSTRAGERHQPRRLVPNERDNLRHFLLAPHERGERHGEVRVRDRPQRRKAIRSELVQRDRLGEVLQPVPAQVEHIVCDQLVGSSREQHLAAVGCAHDPSRLVHVRPDVLGRIEHRLARMHTDPDPHRPVGKRRHRLRHRRYRFRRRRERVEQAVARVINLVARVRTERLPQSAAVVGQRLLISLGAELVQQRRRTLDVREHERHCSRRLQRHRRMICREQLQHKPSASRASSPSRSPPGQRRIPR